MPQNLGETSVWKIDPRRESELGRRAWLTVLSGAEVGRVYSLDVGTTSIGRSTQADIVFGDEQISRLHVEISIDLDGTATVRDAGSTNGTLIGTRSVGEVPTDLRDGAKIQIGGAVILRFSFRDQVEESFERKLYDTLTRDGLTGIYNKRYFDLRLEQELALAERNGHPIGLIMIDLDDFKRINDTQGHAAGDQALRLVAGLFDDHLRDGELIARYGGEEFVVLLRNATRDEALICAERLRRLVFSADLRWNGIHLHVTASFGVASTEGRNYESGDRLVIDADDHLYRAKNSGKNRVCGPGRVA